MRTTIGAMDVLLCLIPLLLLLSYSVAETEAGDPKGTTAKEVEIAEKYDDVNIPDRRNVHQKQDSFLGKKNKKENKVKRQKMWVGIGGSVFKQKKLKGVDKADYLEVASSVLLPKLHRNVGVEIVSLMLRYMPDEVFIELAQRASVGFFTAEESTTIFKEYEYLADTPECEGTCAGDCSDTCTGDGRKWESLAGVGGVRATCLDDNFMCTENDPYGGTDNILVHEFAHTIHYYALVYAPGEWGAKIDAAYLNARDNQIWEPSSYAMSNKSEYFAEAVGVFFNVNNHWSSSGGMSRCGKTNGGYCKNEKKARAFLKQMDPMIYEVLVYAFTNNREDLSSGLKICQNQS